MTLQDILLTKGNVVYSISPDATLDEASKELVHRHVGALVVCADASDGHRLVGILSERDLLYAQAANRGPFSQIKVSEFMTEDVVTGTPDDSIEQVMGLMTTKRIRHLPVLFEGKLIGIVSIGDIVKAEMYRLSMENRFMKDYIGS
jgi:CBS domain-containing protein